MIPPVVVPLRVISVWLVFVAPLTIPLAAALVSGSDIGKANYSLKRALGGVRRCDLET